MCLSRQAQTPVWRRAYIHQSNKWEFRYLDAKWLEATRRDRPATCHL